MKLAVTGFVEESGGSVASANGLLLRALLHAGHRVDFFSKSSFVDPRPVAAGHPGFRFVECDNVVADRLRRKVQRVPGIGFLAVRWDAGSYVRLIRDRIAEEAPERGYDLILWLGDYATGRVPGIPQISFVQGPPGTDARSILDRFGEIRRLAGWVIALRWAVLARLRLGPLGLPRFQDSDQLIAGSRQSKRTLADLYRIPEKRISTLPYPIDLSLFRLIDSGPPSSASSLNLLWLGRIVPRKRLDLFLDGAELAIRDGVDLHLTIVGGIGMVPGYEKRIASFPFPERLTWIRSVPREEVPAWLRRHDVLCQPSDEENFGSSVAEAQACGLPVIVGRTNGNADYLCSRDTHLRDDRPETLAAVFRDYAERKTRGGPAWGDPAESRALAEREFSVERVMVMLEGALLGVIA